MILTDIEKGYIAGFIDGEGAILINKREHIGHKGKRYLGYSAYVDIGNTNKEVLEWLKMKIGVSSSIYENPQSGNRKTAYRIRICYSQSKPLIKELLDHLIVKKRQAEVFLQWPENSNDAKLKQKLFLKMRRLNKRGIQDV